ncbi:hypothetical protein B0I33_10327 [Prauserella shujinwangii]|uniref:DUF6542 domain-containing protein n=2 Tax=Prauserella shujinwangii TaxID=1453103 RepID=A0A2T0LXZ7_9PSEU|nr:hypothetical protein B0I33_10327 [Prauserella shujinwangii]
MFGPWRGLPWWGAVLFAFGLATLGAVADLQLSGALGVVFQASYLVGSVLAIGAVRRRNLFGPMVQPPLILAVTVPAVVLAGSGLPESSDMLAKVLAISTPLINGFPTMAITTGITVAIGVYRMFRERDPDAPRKVRDDRKPSGAPRDEDKRGGARPAKKKESDASRGPAKKRPAEGRGEPPRRAGGAAGAPERRRGAPPPDAAGRRARPEERRRERPPEREPGGGGKARGAGRGGRQPGDKAGGRGGDRSGSPQDPKRPRRSPPRTGEPPSGGPDGPRRGPERGGGRPPRRSRPWDDDRG